jgi:cell division protein FtsI (penicillin-binding protein 3)
MRFAEKKWIRFRIYVVATVFALGLSVILARGYQLQVREREKLTRIARKGYSGVVKLPPMRGTIYDRKGNELAVSVEVASVYAHPQRVEDKARTAEKLARVLSLSKAEVLRELDRKTTFVWLRRKVPPELAERVRKLGLKGVGTTPESKRFYPGKEIAGHLIGFSGTDNQGLEGLEKAYDRYLRGPEYVLIQMRDALRRPFFVSRPTPRDEDGKVRFMHDLVLTIDKHIQYKAQKALQDAVERYRAKSGQCLVVDPQTGEILALAVVPAFNPNSFGSYGPEKWRNRVITDCYEPGSTMKAFLIAAALERTVVSPQTRFYCENGAFEVANHIINDTHEYEELTAEDIVVLSSNIGAVKIGWKLGYRTFTDYLRGFGFGKRTGVDLIGEREGFIRPAADARTIDRANVFFGQGLTVTSVQLAMAMAAVANGGRLMRPYVVEEIREVNGRVVRRTRPKVVRRVISPETARKVKHILSGVVSERGTAPAAAITGYQAAGKTGTAQKVDPKTRRYSRSKYVALFVGFVPVDDPRLVCLVLVNEPKGSTYGGVVAAPAFQEVGRWALNHLRVTPRLKLASAAETAGPREEVTFELLKESGNSGSGEERDGMEENRAGGEAGVSAPVERRLPDFRGQCMREVLRTGTGLGIRVVLEGSGLAVEQEPEPGVGLNRVSSVRVRFSPPL